MISIMHKKFLILSYILRVFILNNLTIQNCPLEADTQHGKKKKKWWFVMRWWVTLYIQGPSPLIMLYCILRGGIFKYLYEVWHVIFCDYLGHAVSNFMTWQCELGCAGHLATFARSFIAVSASPRKHKKWNFFSSKPKSPSMLQLYLEC